MDLHVSCHRTDLISMRAGNTARIVVFLGFIGDAACWDAVFQHRRREAPSCRIPPLTQSGHRSPRTPDYFPLHGYRAGPDRTNPVDQCGAFRRQAKATVCGQNIQMRKTLGAFCGGRRHCTRRRHSLQCGVAVKPIDSTWLKDRRHETTTISVLVVHLTAGFIPFRKVLLPSVVMYAKRENRPPPNSSRYGGSAQNAPPLWTGRQETDDHRIPQI